MTESFDAEKVKAAFDNAKNDVDELVRQFECIKEDVAAKFVNTQNADSSAAGGGDLAAMAQGSFNALMETDFSQLNTTIKDFIDNQIGQVISEYSSFQSQAESVYSSQG